MFHKEILSRTGCSSRHLKGRGLTAVIKKNFFPDYVFVSGGAYIPPTEGGVGWKKKKKKGANGMARGRLVDNQVRLWIQGKPRNEKKFHLFSRAFIELTKMLKLTPVGAQVVVREESCNLATLVDAVFVNSKGKTVVVELKTGFEGYNETSTGKMRGVFSYLTDCPANQHKVQLALTSAMFEKTFPELGKVEALVIRMTSKGAHVRGLSDQVSKTAREILISGHLS